MKIKGILLAAGLIASLTGANAQKGVDNGPNTVQEKTASVALRISVYLYRMPK